MTGNAIQKHWTPNHIRLIAQDEIERFRQEFSPLSVETARKLLGEAVREELALRLSTLTFRQRLALLFKV